MCADRSPSVCLQAARCSVRTRLFNEQAYRLDTPRQAVYTEAMFAPLLKMGPDSCQISCRRTHLLLEPLYVPIERPETYHFPRSCIDRPYLSHDRGHVPSRGSESPVDGHPHHHGGPIFVGEDLHR